MTYKKLTLFAVIYILMISMFGCELPGDNKGGSGPDSGFNSGGGTGDMGNMNPTWMNIMADMMSVQPSSAIGLRVEVGPMENGPFYFEWSASNGFFDNKNSQNCRWTAPNFGTPVNIWCMVKDAKGGQNKRDININVMGGNYQPPAANADPNFTDVHSEPSTIVPGGRVRLVANATDPNFDMINYTWRILNGPANFSNPGPNSQNCDWEAPAGVGLPPSYEFVCSANDGKGGTVESWHVFVYVNSGVSGYNSVPHTINLTASKYNLINFDEDIALTGSAIDDDNDPITYVWEAIPSVPGLPIGIFMPSQNGPAVNWKAPHINASQAYGNSSVYYTINCRIDDGHAHMVFSTVIPSLEILTDTAH